MVRLNLWFKVTHESCHTHTNTGTHDMSLTTQQWMVEGTTTTAATVVSEGQLPMLILHKMGREKTLEQGKREGETKANQWVYSVHIL